MPPPMGLKVVFVFPSYGFILKILLFILKILVQQTVLNVE